MPATVNASDIPADVRKRLGVKRSRTRSMTLDRVRTHAIRVLAVVAELSPAERARVLKHAAKLNDL